MTRRADPLAGFFSHPVTVARLIGHGAYGGEFDTPTVESASIDDTLKTVRTATGDTTTAVTTLALPPDATDIPPGSRITLPNIYGLKRTHTVIVTERADGGDLPTPNHLLVHLE